MRRDRLGNSTTVRRRAAFLQAISAAALAATTAAQPAGVSVGGGGVFGNGPSALASNGALSRWGNAIVFISDATNLVASDTNGVRDVFVLNMLTRPPLRFTVSPSGAHANAPSRALFAPDRPGC